MSSRCVTLVSLFCRVDAMVDHCMADLRSDSASDLHSEFGGAAEVLQKGGPVPAPGPVEAGLAVPVASAMPGKPVDPLRSDSAGGCGGRLAGKVTVAADSPSAGLKSNGGGPTTPGWRQSAADRFFGAAQQSHPAAEQELRQSHQRSRRQGGVAGADPGAAKSHFWQCFRDPALERQFRLSQAALLRPVSLVPVFSCRQLRPARN